MSEGNHLENEETKEMEGLEPLSSDNSVIMDDLTSSGYVRHRRGALTQPEEDDIVKFLEAKEKLRRYESEDDIVVQSKKKSRPIGIIAMIILFAFLTLAHIAAACYLLATPSEYEHPFECLTPNCKRLAKWLEDAYDDSVDPCSNFYQYVCGRWLTNQKRNSVKEKDSNNQTNAFVVGIPFQYEGNEALGSFLQPKDKFPLNQILPYYHSCIFQKRRDQQGYQPLINVLAELNLLYPIGSDSVFPSVARLLPRIFKRTSKMFIIQVINTLQNFMIITVPQLDKEVKETGTQLYADTMRETFHLLQRDLLIDDKEEIDTIIYLVMKFERELHKIAEPNGDNIFDFPHNMSSYLTVPEPLHPNYNDRTTSFRWGDFVDELFEKNDNLTEHHPVILFNYYSSFISQNERTAALILEQFLRNTPYYTMFRFFQWSLIKLYAFHLTEDLQRIMSKLFTSIGPERSERCFRSVFTNLNALAAERYTMDMADSKLNDNKVKNLTNFLVSNMLKLAQDTLSPEHLERVEETFRITQIVESTIQKVSHLLPTFYQGLKMSDDNYFANVLHAQSIRARNLMYKLLKVSPFDKWPSTTSSLNEITTTLVQTSIGDLRYLSIPFGALYEPFFGNDLPIMNVAGIGFWVVCFYLMTYLAFDMHQLANLERDSLNADFVVVYKKRVAELMPRLECMYSSTGELELPHIPGVKLNAHSLASSLSNLADILAVEMLTKIVDKFKDDRSIFPQYQLLPGFTNYSLHQLLFHSIARQSCRLNTKEEYLYLLANGPTPFELRMNGAFRLSKYFAKAWKCPKTSFMNPPKKCEYFRNWTRAYVAYNESALA